jgi:hypothetical protein
MRPEFVAADIAALREHAMLSYRLQRELLVTQILQSPRYADPCHLAHYEAQVYSQHGEDGIISEIFRRIGTTSKFFVEIGVEDGKENNTVYLLSQGWRGAWVEASVPHWDTIRREFHEEIARDQLAAYTMRVGVENAHALNLPQLCGCDLLSIDIDQNTSHVWRALSFLKPRVAVIEYNASIPRDDEWEVEYEADRDWDGSNYFGASLRTLVNIGGEQGMTLLGCDLSGSNAFFVRRDLLAGGMDGPWCPLDWMEFWEPPRYFLLGPRGHRPRYGRSSIK